MATPVTHSPGATTPSLFPPGTPSRYNLKLTVLSVVGIVLSWLALIGTTVAIGLCVHPLGSLILLAAIPLYFISHCIFSHYARNIFIALHVVPDRAMLQQTGSLIPDLSYD
ncbi:hypothetical protein [Candidatus Chlamydia corallus]|uniref:hypothetical protein n=1 Tax=Candidatus Chlamydia corallus TaxID=2038470 RepID=UPI000C2FB665|nr:hypothetical protein [Candidatus Chlamydia corallus]